MVNKDGQEGSVAVAAMTLIVGVGLMVMGQMTEKSQTALNQEMHKSLLAERAQISLMLRSAASCSDPVPQTCDPGKTIALRSKTGKSLVSTDGNQKLGRWNIRVECKSAEDKTFWIYAARLDSKGQPVKDPFTDKVLKWEPVARFAQDCAGAAKPDRKLVHNTCYGLTDGNDALPYEVAKLCATVPPPPPPTTPWPTEQVSIGQVPSATPTGGGGYSYPAPGDTSDYDGSGSYDGGSYGGSGDRDYDGGRGDYDGGYGGGGYDGGYDGGGYDGGYDGGRDGGGDYRRFEGAFNDSAYDVGFEALGKVFSGWLVAEAMAQSYGGRGGDGGRDGGAYYGNQSYGGNNNTAAYGGSNFSSSGAPSSDAGCHVAGKYCGDWQIDYPACPKGYHMTYRYTDRFGWGGMDIAKYSVCDKDAQ